MSQATKLLRKKTLFETNSMAWSWMSQVKVENLCHTNPSLPPEPIESSNWVFERRSVLSMTFDSGFSYPSRLRRGDLGFGPCSVWELQRPHTTRKNWHRTLSSLGFHACCAGFSFLNFETVHGAVISQGANIEKLPHLL